MLIEEYFLKIENDIANCPYVIQTRLTKDKRSLYIGLIAGQIEFTDGSSLHFVEFADAEANDRYKYSYHYQDRNGNMIFRYDMAPHHRDISTFPHHKHIGAESVVESNAPDLLKILEEIEEQIVL